MFNNLNIPLEVFLRSFFESTEKVCLRVFDDRKGGTFKGAKIEANTSDTESIEKNLHKHNALNRGIYFVVNYGGHEDADITRINAHFMECDDISFDEQIANINNFPLEPSLIVKTRKSLHTYWLMKNARVDNFRNIQKRLIAQFGGDKSCINESRVLRLPGFMHCKEEPVMVDCIKFNPELRYTQDELAAALPRIDDDYISPQRTMLKGGRKGLSLVENRCDFIKHCRLNAASLPEHDWYSMITNLAVFEDGDKLIHELSSKYHGYIYNETRDKISHFLESGTKPITCRMIAEKGFVCPHLESDDCGCKSPAALAYKALNSDEIRNILTSIEVSEKPLTNMETACSFVREYLYNVDSLIAATFIEYEVKEHFKFKSGDVKALISLQKELYNTHKSNKETRRESTGVEMPDWYEVSDRGGVRFLAGVLAEYMSKNVDAFYCAEQYYYYRNGVYDAITDLEAKAITRQYMNPRYTSLNNINDAEGQWQMLSIKPIREINPNPYIINVKNGLYNVLDDSFKPHNPQYISTVQLNVNYTPSADCTRFKQYLEESIGGDEVCLIQEILGYFLIPVNKAQKCFVVVGEPGAGKSKLLLTLNELLLGQNNVSNIAWQNLNERFKTAELFGKLANIFADLPTKSIEDNGIFKALVGEDFLTAERKNKDPFSFQPYARLLFSCNSIPRNYGDKSEGFYRRLIIIRFSKPIPAEKQDFALMDKFHAEADGIFMFAIEGLKRLITNRYRFSETAATRDELQRYRIDSNSVLSFVDEWCIPDANAEVSRDEFFNKYKEYCHNAGLSPVSQKNFNKDIEMAFPAIRRASDKIGKRRTWRGIRLDDSCGI